MSYVRCPTYDIIIYLYTCIYIYIYMYIYIYIYWTSYVFPLQVSVVTRVRATWASVKARWMTNMMTYLRPCVRASVSSGWEKMAVSLYLPSIGGSREGEGGPSKSVVLILLYITPPLENVSQFYCTENVSQFYCTYVQNMLDSSWKPVKTTIVLVAKPHTPSLWTFPKRKMLS